MPHYWLVPVHGVYYSKQDFVYPDNVAFPFGGEGQRHYVVIELHYDNPKMVSGKYSVLFVAL